MDEGTKEQEDQLAALSKAVIALKQVLLNQMFILSHMYIPAETDKHADDVISLMNASQKVLKGFEYDQD